MNSDQAKLIRHLAFNQGLTPWTALEAIRMVLDPSHVYVEEEPDTSDTPDRFPHGGLVY